MNWEAVLETGMRKLIALENIPYFRKWSANAGMKGKH